MALFEALNLGKNPNKIQVISVCFKENKTTILISSQNKCYSLLYSARRK